VPTPEVHRVRTPALTLTTLVWGRPQDPAAVLLHGNGGHARWWDPLVPYLVPGWRLVVPHLRGHGDSDWAEPPHYRLRDFADDTVAVMDALAPGRVPVVGHSMGGRVALWLAAARTDRVRALAMLDSRLDLIDARFAERHRGRVAGKRHGRHYASREEAIAAFRFVPDEPGVEPALVRLLAGEAVHEARPGAWTFRFDRGVLSLEGDEAGDLHRFLSGLTCPTFVGAGEASWVLAAAHRERIGREVPQADVQVFPGGHHFLLSCPQRIGPALRAFLDGLDGTR
jgi:pimeloyl-ACP methyl ester carboxylesterase